jgi:hypothetical protein
MKQVYTLPDGSIVLIDWIGEEPKESDYQIWEDSDESGDIYMLDKIKFDRETKWYNDRLLKLLSSSFPTLHEHKEQWLLLEGKKLEEGKDYKTITNYYSSNTGVETAIPIQKEDLWEEVIESAKKYASEECYKRELFDTVNFDKEMANYLKQHYIITRKV